MVGLTNVDDTSDADKPVSTATQTALDLKATIASPILTGVPAAPTAAAATSTTQIATTAFVGDAVSTAVGASVADAINDGTTAIAPSQNAVFDALALKAPIASPTFTGTVSIAAITATNKSTIVVSVLNETTLNALAGRVTILSGESVLKVNNSYADDDSIIVSTIASDNSNERYVKQVISDNFFFTITLNNTASTNLKINFLIIN